MKHVGIFIAGTLGTAIVAFAGCSSSSGGAGASSTTTHSSSSGVASTSSGTAGNPTTSSSSGTTSSSSGTGGSASSSGGPFDAGATFECMALASPPPSGGSCVSFTAAADAGELDGGLDNMGNGSATICNPITNAGCTGTDVCVVDSSGKYYDCFAGDSPAALCGDCSMANCGKGTMCIGVTGHTGQVCVAVCCSDADCAPGKCNKMAFQTPLPSGVGICTPM